MSEFDPNLANGYTLDQKAAQEKTEAFLLKWAQVYPLAPMLKDLIAPPQGFDTWDEYRKYGDMFIPVPENGLVPFGVQGSEDPAIEVHKDGGQ